MICEGNSEEAYINELNKYIRERCLNLSFKAYNLCGVSKYGGIKRKYRLVRQVQKNSRDTSNIFIWLDDDIFKKGRLSKEKLQQILRGFSGIKYNYENFEDFLVMHLPKAEIEHWHRKCEENNHFNVPMVAENVERLIKLIFPDYSKGVLPQAIQLSDDLLNRLCENQKNATIKFESDFIGVIEKVLKLQTDTLLDNAGTN